MDGSPIGPVFEVYAERVRRPTTRVLPAQNLALIPDTSGYAEVVQCAQVRSSELDIDVVVASLSTQADAQAAFSLLSLNRNLALVSPVDHWISELVGVHNRSCEVRLP
jgi:hypothetical protein